MDYFLFRNHLKNEAIKYLGYAEDKVYNISSACNRDIFNIKKVETDKSTHSVLDTLDHYILYSGASDPRKNIKGLLKAYSKLPFEVLLKYKLVFSGKLLPSETDLIHGWIKEFSIK